MKPELVLWDDFLKVLSAESETAVRLAFGRGWVQEDGGQTVCVLSPPDPSEETSPWVFTPVKDTGYLYVRYLESVGRMVDLSEGRQLQWAVEVNDGKYIVSHTTAKCRIAGMMDGSTAYLRWDNVTTGRVTMRGGTIAELMNGFAAQ